MVRAEAVVLVAGISSRIQEVTKGQPKCFLRVGEETLIQRSLRILRAQGVERITLVTGFMEHLFRTSFPECNFVSNADYKSTNTGVSLKLALADALERNSDRGRDRRIFVLNGDVYYDEGVIAGMLASTAGDTLAAIKRHPLSHEEIKVFVEDGRVVKIGKYLDDEIAHAEAFGVYLLSHRFANYLLRELRLQHNPKIFYEAGMDQLLAGGHVMHAHDVGDAVVQEIDFPDDYFALQKLIAG